ncbi:hypothetical protein DW839_18505 [Enterocloster bolteae]|uniref:Uncharacterized protein n=1 Tax=Enterocloster bolteae TaxID=208479 RepID=A0A414AT27_9FIRM|nr:hypothetical protein DW839_18505 [Enterocloster bolteae]
MIKVDLKPCPFCGGIPELRQFANPKTFILYNALSVIAERTDFRQTGHLGAIKKIYRQMQMLGIDV